MPIWNELRCSECRSKFLVRAEDAVDRDEFTCPLCDDTVELPDESDSEHEEEEEEDEDDE